MKKHAFLWKGMMILAACLLFFRFSYDTQAGVQERQDVMSRYQALDRLNEVRRHLNLREVTFSKELNAMAGSHSLYMSEAQLVTSEELPTDENFTGVYPKDRAKAAGYNGGYVTERCGFRMKSYTGFITWCLQDPILRGQLLSPQLKEIGIGYEGVYYTLDFGSEEYQGDPQVEVYPYAGQQGVDNVTMAELSYIPDTITYNRASMLGTPITIQYLAEDLTEVSFENVKVSLIDTKKEREMDCVSVFPSEETRWNTLIIYPTVRYESKVKYSVEVSFDVYSEGVYLESVTKSWSFTSAGPELIGEVKGTAFEEALAEKLAIEPEAVLEEEGYVTREQAMFRIIEVLKEQAPGLVEKQVPDYKDTFEDINQCSEEYREAVQLAYQLGIAEDQGAGIFNPQAYITLNECEEALDRMAALLNR